MSECSINFETSYGDFNLLAKEKANGLVDVCKYQSSKTGLKVVLGEVEGPVVNGYFVLATEAYDDDGLPHTLEHLIFLGSEDYPFKGVLDLLANRILAPGSNAWTDTDHTCYTVTTAGSEGFLSIMPIYIDHILYPTLTDSGYVTEVHHINGEGKDAGVIYCEQEGTENTGEHIVFSELLAQIYPGKCSYKSHIGGKLQNLRESTSLLKIQNYHKQYYRPDNLTLIVTGQVDPVEFFKALKPVEDKIISKGPLGHFERPWQTPIPPFTESKDVLVLYPNDSEDNGMVYVGWRGPSAVHELYEMSACSTLLRFMTDTLISWLQKDFVELDDPYASSVSFSLQENSQSVLYLIFENVSTKKLDLVKDRLFQSLNRFYEDPTSLNMTRLKSVIQKQKAEALTSLENQPHDSIAFMVIGDMLYGNTAKDLQNRLNVKDLLDRMANEPETFWKSLFKKYLLDGPSVTIRGKPSIAEQQKLTKIEQERVAKTIASLGPEGLKAKEKILNDAIKQNDIPPPDELLTKLPIPDTNKICFHCVRTYTEDDNHDKKIDFSTAPVYMCIDDLKTNFVYMIVIMNTESLSKELRPYLLLYLESILELPIHRGNRLIDHEEVVAQLEADTIAVSTKLGLGDSPTRRFTCGSYCHSVNLVIQVEPKKYEDGVKWLKQLLFDTVFTKERLKIIATKIINDVPQWKRKGSKIAYDLMKGMCFNEGSNHYWNSLLRQHKFLTELVEKLDNAETAESVLAELDCIKKMLTDPNKMAVHMAANLSTLSALYPNILSPWSQFLPTNLEPAKVRYSVVNDFAHLEKKQIPQGCLVGLGCVDSAFLCQTVPSINNFSDPDLPALMVFLQYLTQAEGPLWKQIRGQGLSYSYTLNFKPNEGLLYLSFYRSTNVFASFKETKKIIQSYLDEEIKFDETLIDSAKSSLIFEIVESEKCISDVVLQSILAYFKDVSHSYNKDLVSKVFQVTAEELLRVGRKYVARLFDTKSKISIVCHPSKANEIATNFKQLNLEIEIHKCLEDTFLNVI